MNAQLYTAQVKSTTAIVAQMSQKYKTVFWLNLRPVSQDEANTWHHYWEQKLVPRQVIDSEAEPTILFCLVYIY